MAKITRKKFIKEWIKDLESGKYEQCLGRLSDGSDGYCCLGVACRTGQRLGIKSAKFGQGQNMSSGVPGGWFEKIMGCKNLDLTYRSQITSATELNDKYRLSFKENRQSSQKEISRMKYCVAVLLSPKTGNHREEAWQHLHNGSVNQLHCSFFQTHDGDLSIVYAKAKLFDNGFDNSSSWHVFRWNSVIEDWE